MKAVLSLVIFLVALFETRAALPDEEIHKSFNTNEADFFIDKFLTEIPSEQQVTSATLQLDPLKWVLGTWSPIKVEIDGNIVPCEGTFKYELLDQQTAISFSFDFSLGGEQSLGYEIIGWDGESGTIRNFCRNTLPAPASAMGTITVVSDHKFEIDDVGSNGVANHVEYLSIDSDHHLWKCGSINVLYRRI